MHSDTPQILQKKPGEPGGEKARALIAAWKEWADWEMSPGTEAWWLNALAGALAACALAEAKWWEHLVTNEHHDPDCEKDCMYCARLAALERAAEGK